MQAVVAVQIHFQAHHTNILLATIPKAGTTWLKAISFALLNRMHYPYTQQYPLLTDNPHVFCPSWSLTFTTKRGSKSHLLHLSQPIYLIHYYHYLQRTLLARLCFFVGTLRTLLCVTLAFCQQVGNGSSEYI
jgi:hypothetical protein